MDITFYKTNSSKNKINKTLSTPITKSIVLKNKDSIFNPILIMKGFQTLKNYNYCYIPFLARYYFITKKRILNNDFIELTLKTDVLMTYKSNVTSALNLESNEGVELQTHRLDSNVILPENEVSYLLLTVGK